MTAEEVLARETEGILTWRPYVGQRVRIAYAGGFGGTVTSCRDESFSIHWDAGVVGGPLPFLESYPLDALGKSIIPEESTKDQVTLGGR